MLIWSLGVSAEQRVQVGYVNFPPFEYSDHGRPRGPLIETLQEVAKEAGLRLEFRLLKRQQLYRFLRDGSIDLWPGLTDVPELADHIYQSRHILMHLRLSAYAIAPTPTVQSLSELQGRRLIFITGYSYGGLGQMLGGPASQNTILFSSSHEAALQMLAKGSADYLIDYDRPVQRAQRLAPVKGLQASLISQRDAAFIVSRQIPHAWDLMEKLDQAYASLLQKGVIKPENQ